MVAEPRWSCTIPSIYDDTPLDVRIYHPSTLPSQSDKPWRKRGIVVAHPYASMGGSYDDRVVGIVADEFLSAGWIVGTFNFRGAHAAKGRTSWSGRPELGDYHSFAAFFMHYLSYLLPTPPPDQSPVSPVTVAATQQPDGPAPIVVLGGYSYGSLILRNLPPLPSLLAPFAAPTPGSAPAEILLIAHKLADADSLEFLSAARDTERRRRGGHEHKLSVKMGGEETSPEMRRSSREIRRSVDGGGRGHDIGSRLRSLSHGQYRRVKDASAQPQSQLAEAQTRPQIQVPLVRYLLVSPITTPTATLAAPGLARGWWSRAGDADAALKMHETLAVYGEHDMFASTRRLREWAVRMEQANRTQGGFCGVEVKGAGHFWHEHGVERELREALRGWERSVRD